MMDLDFLVVGWSSSSEEAEWVRRARREVSVSA